MGMSLTNLPVSRETASSTPATVMLVLYCMLLTLVIFWTVEAEPRGVSGELWRTSRGNTAALTDKSRSVRSKESDIKERIKERIRVASRTGDGCM